MRSTTKLWFQPHIRLTFFQDSSMLKHKQYFRFSCLILFCCMCLQHTGFLSMYASSDRQLDTFSSSAVVNRAYPGSLSAVLCGKPKSGNTKSYGNSLLLRSCPTGKTTAAVLSAPASSLVRAPAGRLLCGCLVLRSHQYCTRGSISTQPCQDLFSLF